MKKLIFLLATLLFPIMASAQAKVMNPGEAYGQLIFLSVDDVKMASPKYLALSPLSIPVFAELPLDMSVVAGAITLKQQNLLSHVQLKSRARHTPNLDISGLNGGMTNPLLAAYQDGQWIHLVLGKDNSILIEASTEAAANAFIRSHVAEPLTLKSDLSETRILSSQELGSQDAIRVGAKAANYSELVNALNTASRTVIRPGFAIPFYYYQEFVDTNPAIREAIDSLLQDPLMSKLAKVSYREAKLKSLQALMTAETAVVSDQLVNELISKFDQVRFKGVPKNIKLRSSTNSEDLPNFNGAGLYSSDSYKPAKSGIEKSTADKALNLKKVLRTVWASVWNLRAFDERTHFGIPHADVKMGLQVNPSFGNEGADGVVVTRNIADNPAHPGDGIYIEVQRGDTHAVANPEPGVKPEKILVLYDTKDPQNTDHYDIQILQKSNVADDTKTILPQDNPKLVMSIPEIKDLAMQVLRARDHLKPILGAGNPSFALDLEFKVDSEDTGSRAVYLKQARPYVD